MTSSGSRRKTVFRLVRWLIAAIVAVLLLPYLIAPLYRLVDPVSTLMLGRWVTGARVVRTVLPIERVAPSLPLAVIVAEDARFCAHRGIDWTELREAIDDADSISAARGQRHVDRIAFAGAGADFTRRARAGIIRVLMG